MILLAGLQRIPQELYEAASVDGANVFQKFFFITLPSLQPVLFVMGPVGTLLSFNVFDDSAAHGGSLRRDDDAAGADSRHGLQALPAHQAAAMSVVTG